MEQTRGLFCTCDSGVALCQSHHQCHFWRMSLAAVNQIYVIHEAMNGCKNLKINERLCFKNVNIIEYMVGNLFSWQCMSGAVKRYFWPCIQWCISPNEHFEYGSPLSNALLGLFTINIFLSPQIRVLQDAQSHMSSKEIWHNYVKIFPAGYTVPNFGLYPISLSKFISIENIFLSVSFTICFGCSKEPSHLRWFFWVPTT